MRRAREWGLGLVEEHDNIIPPTGGANSAHRFSVLLPERLDLVTRLLFEDGDDGGALDAWFRRYRTFWRSKAPLSDWPRLFHNSPCQ